MQNKKEATMFLVFTQYGHTLSLELGESEPHIEGGRERERERERGGLHNNT